MKKKFTHGDASERGTIRQITYTTRNEKGETVEKYANIYLPCRLRPGEAVQHLLPDARGRRKRRRLAGQLPR